MAPQPTPAHTAAPRARGVARRHPAERAAEGVGAAAGTSGRTACRRLRLQQRRAQAGRGFRAPRTPAGPRRRRPPSPRASSPARRTAWSGRRRRRAPPGPRAAPARPEVRQEERARRRDLAAPRSASSAGVAAEEAGEPIERGAAGLGRGRLHARGRAIRGRRSRRASARAPARDQAEDLAGAAQVHRLAGRGDADAEHARPGVHGAERHRHAGAGQAVPHPADARRAGRRAAPAARAAPSTRATAARRSRGRRPTSPTAAIGSAATAPVSRASTKSLGASTCAVAAQTSGSWARPRPCAPARGSRRSASARRTRRASRPALTVASSAAASAAARASCQTIAGRTGAGRHRRRRGC